ncbi:glycosyltransferase family 2 protein [Candidatus Gottesmanbacteria bacterium]|nr:glycosyltransferase family 2 protein [Candidatus Gottesmanbacteria bacterium]
MNKPYLSVVIPAYNAGEKLSKLLVSLGRSKYKNFEVIVGDDGSEEEQRSKIKDQKSNVRIVRLLKNRGPAAARNEAARLAKGRVLVFLDSDTEVYADTLSRIAEKFENDDDLTALTGVWDKHQRTRDFFPQFKALRDWSYWTNERDSDGYYYLFSTRIAALKRDVFSRLGGFNEAFRQMEDVEMTYRIARRYAIIFADDVRVHHEFEGFFAVARKYFWRSYYWSRMYRERRKFDPVATTMWETLAALSGVATVGFFVWAVGVIIALGLVLSIKGLVLSTFMIEAVILLILGSLVFLCIHIFFLRKFLGFVYKEKGMVFTVKSLGVGMILYCVILLGSAYFFLRKSMS